MTPPAANSSLFIRERGPSLHDPEVEALLLRLHGATDVPQFWTALQDLFRDVIPNDALVVFLNYLDFSRTWKASQILATSNAKQTPEWFERRRKVDFTPPFILSHPRIELFRISDLVPTPRDLKRTEFFRHYMAPHGWHHIACSLYWQGAGLGSEIAIRRTKAQGEFTAGEMDFLKRLHPHLETMLNRLLAMQEERARRLWLEEFNHHLPFALLFLNWELKPVFANREAMEQCAIWNFGPVKAAAYRPQAVFEIPAVIAQGCADLKARWLEAQSEPSAAGESRVSVRLVHPSLPGLTAVIALQADSSCPTAKPGFVVHLNREGSDADEPRNLPVQAHMKQLSPAERDLARLVCRGLTNEEVAAQQGKCVSTVKSQLSSIFRKLGVSNRTRLVTMLR